MAADPPPAEFLVSRLDPDGVATIHACGEHVAESIRVWLKDNVTGVVAVRNANIDVMGNALDSTLHGCKGHQENWPTG